MTDIQHQIDRLAEQLDRLDAIADKFTSNEPAQPGNTGDPFKDVEIGLQQRGEQALKELMVWTAWSLRDMAKHIGVDRRVLSRILKGEGSTKSIRKVLVYRKRYAEKTGRQIND